MKGLYFLVVLCAVVCTVWSEAEWQDCNFMEEMKECVDQSHALTYGGKGLLFTSKEELDRSCRSMNRVLQCIENYARRCVMEEDQYHIHNKLNRTKQAIKKICDPGPYQEELLLHGPCLEKHSDDYERFLLQYTQKMPEFLAKLGDPDMGPANGMFIGIDSVMRTVCSLFRSFVDGVQRVAMEKCGEKTAKFIEDTLIQILEAPKFKDMCKIYLHGSDQYQDSSASRNFQRALLLPVSLAMLSLYALRST